MVHCNFFSSLSCPVNGTRFVSIKKIFRQARPQNGGLDFNFFFKKLGTVIVYDADNAVLDILTTALEMEGFAVCPLMHCGEDLLQLIGQVRPDLVMLDYRLNDRPCLEALKNIKEKYPGLPVIATSCNHNISQEYRDLGFDGYIAKPFDLDLLYRVLREHIAKPEMK